MKTVRQRVWLTAVAVAGSIALYGCGGGSGGPDTTPYDQDYVDQKADEAKKAEEERLAAIRAATEAAGKAATAAGEADQAARDAEAAAKAATTHAVYGTLDADEAAAQSTIADNAKKAADAALVAANDALAEADAVIHSDPEVTNQKGLARASASAADASAKAAAGFATEAKTQADIARATQTGIDNARLAAQEQGKQRRIAANEAEKADTAAGTAAAKATEAEAEAEDALPAAQAALAAAQQALTDNKDDSQTAQLTEAVTKAQAAVTAATTRDADYKTRAENAAAAAAAAEAARDAAKTASEDAAAAAEAAGDTEEGSPGAISAAAAADSYTAARASFNTAQAWSDIMAAIKARSDADGLEAPLADILRRIPWARDYSRATDLSDQLEEAQHAAERLAQQKDPDSGGTATYQEDVRGALKVVTDDAAGMTEALATARAAHDAAKPWSVNGRAVDNATGAEGENLATGAILINEDGRINLGGNKEDDPATPDNERLNVVADVTSPPSDWGPYDRSLGWGNASFNGNYLLLHYNRWDEGSGKVYDYVSYGVWAQANRSLTGVVWSPDSNGSLRYRGGDAFALVKDGAPPTAPDGIGTASFTGHNVTYRIHPLTGLDIITEGPVNARVNFAQGEAELHVFRWGRSDPDYSVRNITVDGNILSGGTGSTTLTFGTAIYSDFRITLHAEIFGNEAQEMAGTIKVNGTRYGRNPAEFRTAFAARNDAHR